MCGRFVGFRSIDELKAFFPIDVAVDTTVARYNIAPSQEILAIIRRGAENHLDYFHWGLVPFWAKDIHIGVKMINARAETVASKPSFKTAFRKRRCLIPTDGFYEWRNQEGKKQPLFFTLPEDKPFAFAGLWEVWRPKDSTGASYRSCTIITTAASETVRAVHHRMPVVLSPAVYADWLDPQQQDIATLKEMMVQHIISEFRYYPVSGRVNSAGRNDPENIKPLAQIPLDL